MEGEFKMAEWYSICGLTIANNANIMFQGV